MLLLKTVSVDGDDDDDVAGKGEHRKKTGILAKSC